MCQDTTTHTCTPSPTLSLPVLEDKGSVLHGARGALTAGLAAGFRPQLFLKFLDHLLQVLPGLPLVQEIGAELLPVGLRVLQLHLQVLDLWGQHRHGCRTQGQDGACASPQTLHRVREAIKCVPRHGIIKIEARKEFPVPFILTLLQYSACLSLKPKYGQWLQLQKGRWKPEELRNSSRIP